MSLLTNCLPVNSQVALVKPPASKEMDQLKKRMWLSGAASAVSAIAAIVAIAIVPIFGQVLFGLFLGFSLVSGGNAYLAYKDRVTLSGKSPDLLKDNAPEIFSQMLQKK